MGSMTPKYWMHGYAGGTSYPPGDFQALNDNVYRMLAVYNIRPHLAVLDAYQGTEHNGPHQGSSSPIRKNSRWFPGTGWRRIALG